MEMTLVGMYADTSPACVSMIGSAVSEPPGFEDRLVVDDARVLAQLGGTLEQPGVQVEHVTGIGLATGRPSQHEGDLAVRRGLLRQIVVHAERRLALVIHEVLRHGAARVGRDVLHRSGIGRRSVDDDRVRHRALVAQLRFDRSHRRRFLTDRDVDAGDAGALLIDDRIDGDRRLADPSVADDQLALPASDRDHRVHRLDPRLEGLLARVGGR